jgi:manganese/zinc/iron transport system substrate-binding protein
MYPSGKLKVLCTTAMCADLVAAVGGDQVDCLTLIQGESDPHSYQLVKGDDEKFARADIIFYSGLGLEHGPSLSHMLENNSRAHALGEYIRSIHPDEILFVDNTVDPHIWMDVGLWKESITYIADVLSKVRPFKAEDFRARAAKELENYTQADAEIRAILQSIPESLRYLVTTHDAFNYFSRAYLCERGENIRDESVTQCWKERSQAPEGLAPDSQLSTADIKRLVDHIVKYRIKVVFAESNVNRDSLKKLVDSVGSKGHQVLIATKPLYADSLGEKGGPAGTYINMMRYNAETISEGLR